MIYLERNLSNTQTANLDVTINLIKIRNCCTPATIASFVVMSVTGVLMFFRIHQCLNALAHKWIGIIFVLFCLIHLATNFKSFVNHLRKPSRVIIMCLGILVLSLSFLQLSDKNQKSGPIVIIERINDLPLATVISISGKSESIIKTILKDNNVQDIDIKQSASSIFHGDRFKSVELISSILKK